MKAAAHGKGSQRLEQVWRGSDAMGQAVPFHWTPRPTVFRTGLGCDGGERIR